MAGGEEPTRVRCYSGYRADERPVRFELKSGPMGVSRILRAWKEPDHRCFDLLGDDGARYLLRHYERDDRWSVEAVPPRRSGTHDRMRTGDGENEGDCLTRPPHSAKREE